MASPDAFDERRKHLQGLSDEALEAHFWQLTNEIVDPLITLARTHTSPSIERSVLMRMGVDSPTCVAVVNEVDKRGLLGHGAGHIVWRCSQEWGIDVRAAALKLAGGAGWDKVESLWAVRNG